MNKIFNKDDIKAGYLLVVENKDDKEKFNMTVLPTRNNGKTKLGCCCPEEEEWWSLDHFNSDLEYPGSRLMSIKQVYGPVAHNGHLLDNNTYDRELLWERKDVKKLTVEEVSKMLGYEVEIVAAH